MNVYFRQNKIHTNSFKEDLGKGEDGSIVHSGWSADSFAARCTQLIYIKTNDRTIEMHH